MAVTAATRMKKDASNAEASISKTEIKSAKPLNSIEANPSPHLAGPKILHNLKPSARRSTYPFDAADPEHEPRFMRALAFEQQNDRELEAECDALIEHAIREVWAKAGFTRFRHLRIDVQGGNVNLRGWLDCFYHKQMAQSLIRPIHGVKSIENDIQVKS